MEQPRACGIERGSVWRQQGLWQCAHGGGARAVWPFLLAAQGGFASTRSGLAAPLAWYGVLA